MTTNDKEWYNEWQRLVQWVTTSSTTYHNEWQRVTKNENEWQRMTKSHKTNENEEEWFQNETKDQSGSWRISFNFYAICNYYIFSNIDNLKIGKLMKYIFNIIFCVSIMSVFLDIFRHQFCWKLIVKCELLFEKIT